MVGSNLRRLLRPWCEATYVDFLSCIPVAQYLIFCVVFVDQHLSFCPISFGHYIVCYSSIDLRLLVTSLVSSDVSY